MLRNKARRPIILFCLMLALLLGVPTAAPVRASTPSDGAVWTRIYYWDYQHHMIVGWRDDKRPCGGTITMVGEIGPRWALVTFPC